MPLSYLLINKIQLFDVGCTLWGIKVLPAIEAWIGCHWWAVPTLQKHNWLFGGNGDPHAEFYLEACIS